MCRSLRRRRLAELGAHRRMCPPSQYPTGSRVGWSPDRLPRDFAAAAGFLLMKGCPGVMRILPAVLAGSLLCATAAAQTSGSVSLPASPVVFPVAIWGGSSSTTATVSNPGPGALIITAISLSNPEFSLQQLSCGTLPVTIPAGGSCSLTITFQPAYAGWRFATVSLTDSAAGSPHQFTVQSATAGAAPTGSGLSAVANFGAAQPIGVTTDPINVFVSNINGTPVTITGFSTNSTEYAAQPGNCLGTLPISGSCTARMTFTPAAVGSRRGLLIVASNVAGSPQYFDVFGSGGDFPRAQFYFNGAAISLLDLGNQLIGTAATYTATLASTGSQPLAITAITFSSDTSELTQTNNCPASLPPATSCAFQVRFAPTGYGVKNATLTVTENADSAPRQLPIRAMAVSPGALSLSASGLSFGAVPVHTPSAPQSVTVTNSGGGPLTIAGITAEGPFAQQNNCPATMGPGATCTIQVTFTPPDNVLYQFGSITIADDAPGSPHGIGMDGTGSGPPESGVVSRIAGNQDASGPPDEPALNPRGALIAWRTSRLNTDCTYVALDVQFHRFKDPVDCPTPWASTPFTFSGLALQTSSGLDSGVITQPSSNGYQVGAVYIGINGSHVPGFRIAPAARTPNGDTDFVQLGGTRFSSDGAYVVFHGAYATASGTSPLTVMMAQPCSGLPSSPCTTNATVVDFGQSPAASDQAHYIAFVGGSGSLAPGQVLLRDTCNGAASCTPRTLQVALTPAGGQPDAPSAAPAISADGRYVAFESAATNLVPGDTNSASDIFLRDTCLGAPQGCTPTTTRISVSTIGGDAAGPSRAPQISFDGRYVTFISGASNLVPTGTNALDNVFLRDTCLDAPGCTPRTLLVSVRNDGALANAASTEFSASADAQYVAFTSQASNLYDDQQNTGGIFLALPRPAALSLTPSIIAATTDPNIAFTSLLVTDNSSRPLTITNLSATPPFTVTSDCPTTMYPGGSCYLNLHLPLYSLGHFDGRLTITHDGDGAVQNVPIHLDSHGPVVTVTPASLSFPATSVGGSRTLQVQARNDGDSRLSIWRVRTTGDFTASGCIGWWNPGTSCIVTVTFAPTTTGARSGVLGIDYSAVGGGSEVPLTGTGATAQLAANPALLAFPANNVGANSTPQVLTLSNTGSLAVAIASVGMSGDFAQTSNCGASLAPGASCSISVTFTPAAGGPRSGQLTIANDSPAGALVVALTGTGSEFVLSPGSGPTSATIARGQSAQFGFTVQSVGGFNGVVSSICSGAPPGGGCTVTPTTVTVDPIFAIGPSVAVTVTTAASAAQPGPVASALGGSGIIFGAVLGLGLLLVLRRHARRLWSLSTPLALTLLFVLVACGGGNSSGGSSPPPPSGSSGTPPGSYTVVVTATSGAMTRTLNLTVNVQ